MSASDWENIMVSLESQYHQETKERRRNRLAKKHQIARGAWLSAKRVGK